MGAVVPQPVDGERANSTRWDGMTFAWQWSEASRMWMLVAECDCGIAHVIDMSGAASSVLVDCVCGHAAIAEWDEVPRVA